MIIYWRVYFKRFYESVVQQKKILVQIRTAAPLDLDEKSFRVGLQSPYNSSPPSPYP